MREYIPTQAEKHAHLLEVFKRRGHDVFIESGTYQGDTVRFFRGVARRIVSIEIDPTLYAGYEAPTPGGPRFILGDATEWIPRLLREADAPPLVYLDGHYSGLGTGQGMEIEPAVTIFKSITTFPPGTSVIVDDLRLFGASRAYPTLDALITSAVRAFPLAMIYASLDALVVESP